MWFGRGAGVAMIVATAALSAAPGRAQLAGSLAVATDYRLRGLSLNGGGLAVTASLFHDRRDGIYAGASATVGDTRRFGPQFLSHVVNVGYAARIDERISWEAGFSRTQVHSNVFTRVSGNYAEFYGGLSTESASARLFVSRDFLASGLHTLYLDLNGTLSPAERLRLSGHFGLLVPLGAANAGVLPRARYDLRLAAAADLGRHDISVAFVRSGAGREFLAQRLQVRDAIVVGASWNF
jgi:uncharacterized protein (TIGR02001 family)